MRKLPSLAPVAIHRPSGLYAAQNTRLACPTSSATCVPVAASHTRTVPSSDDERIRRLSGLKASEVINSRWPCGQFRIGSNESGFTSWSVGEWMSHTAMVAPFGLHATGAEYHDPTNMFFDFRTSPD